MSLFTAQLYPGRALGFLVIGASLHDVLTRLKAEPQRFPKLDLVYSPNSPVTHRVVVTLPANGIRLQFDGPVQQLRLIEVLDFTKNHIFFKSTNDKELYLVRPPNASQAGPAPTYASEPAVGPSFRHIYQRFLGPTYNGEFIPDASDLGDAVGTYVLSYPGVAFTFPMPASGFSPRKDVVSLLSSSTSQIATSMAIFNGDSWAEARENLWTEELPSIRTFAPLSKGKKAYPEEISYVIIHGGGNLQLCRTGSNDDDFWIRLGETTPQELVARLGPPDAIYRKNDQRMHIHKIRAASNTVARPNGNDLRRPDDLTDTDQSSAHTTSDDYDSSDEAVLDETVANVSGECFYNYFYLGFDILVSTATAPSRLPPSEISRGPPRAHVISAADSADKLVATKLVLHGNVPGSYPFNRHRRCNWLIGYLKGNDDEAPLSAHSDTHFSLIEEQLRDEWQSIYASEEEARQQHRGMVLNRGWGDNSGSSCELLGGWEESGGAGAQGAGGKELDETTTTLYGFPGLVFEVLKNGYVSALTVY